jgi:hypothetical protein
MYHEKQLDIDFISFHRNDKGRSYTRYKMEDYAKVIKTELQECEQLFLYYTGHLTEQGEFCFGSDKVSVEKLLTNIGGKLPIYCQVCCVIDACYSGINVFPYSFDGQRLKLTDKIDNCSFAMKQDCIYIYSASLSEEAATSEYQSYFTKYLLKQLEAGISSFSVLLQETQKRLVLRKKTEVQTAGILTSQRIQPNLWPWIFGCTFLDLGTVLLIR